MKSGHNDGGHNDGGHNDGEHNDDGHRLRKFSYGFLCQRDTVSEKS